MELIPKYYKEISDLCKAYNVNKLYAFGSVTRKDFNTESDIDLIVDFNPVPLFSYADNYFDFNYKLEELLKREIDLIDSKSIKNPYFKEEVEKSRVLVYG